MVAALAQIHILWEDKQGNFEKIVAFVSEAKEKKADIIFFPEMSLTGFSMNTKVTGEDDTQETVGKIKNLCRKEKMPIGIGWTRYGKEKAENHYTVVNCDGNICSDYIKIHPFSYAGEKEIFQGGNKISYYKLGDYTWCTFICYDLRFPEIFQIASQKADIIVVPANWPENRTDHWRTLLKARAIESQSFILGINCVGVIGNISYSGFTSAYSPEGQCLNELSDMEGLVMAELDYGKLAIRESFPVRQDRKWTLYSQEFMNIVKNKF